MKTPIRCLALIVALISFALPPSMAVTPPARQFHLEITITGLKGLNHPLPLTVKDGKPATFKAGAEIPDDAGDLQYVSVGVQGKIRVHQLAPDQLRVSIYATQSTLDDNNDNSNILIHESGLQCLKTLKSGDPINLDLGSGRKINVTISPAS